MATEKFLDGFKRFQQDYFGNDNSLYASMKEGQPAKTMMVACCDSRSDPAIVTDCDPGDLFIVRNVANLVPPCEEAGQYHGTSAALEYAVNSLEVENIIVMGHANCGGIHALWEDDGTKKTQFIQPWILLAEEAKKKVKKTHEHADKPQQLTACEKEAVLVSLGNLLSFSWIKERVEQGSLKLHGWYFDVRAGELYCYQADKDEFVPVS